MQSAWIWLVTRDISISYRTTLCDSATVVGNGLF